MLQVPPGGLPQAVRQINGATHTQLNTATGNGAQLANLNVDASVTPVIMMPSAGGGAHISAELLSSTQAHLSSLNSNSTTAQLLPPGTLFTTTTSLRDPDSTSAIVPVSNCSLLSVAPDGSTSSPAGDPLAMTPSSHSPKRTAKTSKLSEEEQSAKRLKLALLMRQKRANESEEQKVRRRKREAERMRKRRSMEDELQKVKRREEAADRARMRRASMSAEQRQQDRKKAAERMRIRRKNEGCNQKILRRKRAAERMRVRRAEESPDQKAARRQYSAQRMKTRRCKKNSANLSAPTSSNEDSFINIKTAIGDFGSIEGGELSAADFANSQMLYSGDSKVNIISGSTLSSEQMSMISDGTLHTDQPVYIASDIIDSKSQLALTDGGKNNYSVITAGTIMMSDVNNGGNIKRLHGKQVRYST